MRGAAYGRLLLLLPLIVGCEGGCRDPEVIARLAKKQGDVQRDEGRALGRWTPAAPGDRFVLGDALVTADDARALVEFTAGGNLRVRERTLVRFLERRDEAPGIAVELADAIPESRGGIRFGRALIDPESSVDIERVGPALEIRVSYGRVVFERGNGPARVVPTGGPPLRVGSSSVALSRAPPPSPPPIPMVTARLVAKGKVRIRARGARRYRHLAAGTSTSGEGLRVEIHCGHAEIDRGSTRYLAGKGRLVLGGTSGVLAQVGAGRGELDGQEADAEIGVPGGRVEAHAVDGVARVEVGPRSTSVESVGGGRVRVHGRDATTEESPLRGVASTDEIRRHRSGDRAARAGQLLARSW